MGEKGVTKNRIIVILQKNYPIRAGADFFGVSANPHTIFSFFCTHRNNELTMAFLCYIISIMSHLELARLTQYIT